MSFPARFVTSIVQNVVNKVAQSLNKRGKTRVSRYTLPTGETITCQRNKKMIAVVGWFIIMCGLLLAGLGVTIFLEKMRGEEPESPGQLEFVAVFAVLMIIMGFYTLLLYKNSWIADCSDKLVYCGLLKNSVRIIEFEKIASYSIICTKNGNHVAVESADGTVIRVDARYFSTPNLLVALALFAAKTYKTDVFLEEIALLEKGFGCSLEKLAPVLSEVHEQACHSSLKM